MNKGGGFHIKGKPISRTRKTKEEIDKERLLIDDLLELKPLKVPQDISRDVKKLTKFLMEMSEQFNRMIKGVQKFNRLAAGELIARPTYAEEFQNIRENVNKVVVPNDPESWMRSQRSLLNSEESRVN